MKIFGEKRAVISAGVALLIVTLLCMSQTVLAITLPTPQLQKAIYTIKELPIVGSLVGAKLFWQVGNSSANGDVDGFMVYRNDTLWKIIPEKKAKTTLAGEKGYTVSDKYYKWDRNRDKSYNYTVKAFKGDNFSNYSNVKSIYIVENDTVGPTKPTNLKVLDLNSGSVKVSWKASLDDRVCSVSTIRNRFLGVEPENNLKYGVFINGNKSGKEIKNNEIDINWLEPEKTYNISVFAHDQKGNPSQLSENITITTPKTIKKTKSKTTIERGNNILVNWLKMVNLDSFNRTADGLSQNITVTTLNTITKQGSEKKASSACFGGSLCMLGTKLQNSLNNFSFKGAKDKLLHGASIKNALADLNSLKSKVNLEGLRKKIKF